MDVGEPDRFVSGRRLGDDRVPPRLFEKPPETAPKDRVVLNQHDPPLEHRAAPCLFHAIALDIAGMFGIRIGPGQWRVKSPDRSSSVL
jgi:hypothetical protein